MSDVFLYHTTGVVRVSVHQIVRVRDDLRRAVHEIQASGFTPIRLEIDWRFAGLLNRHWPDAAFNVDVTRVFGMAVESHAAPVLRAVGATPDGVCKVIELAPFQDDTAELREPW